MKRKKQLNIAPPLELLFFIKTALISGDSVYEAIESYVIRPEACDFTKNIKEWFEKIKAGQETDSVLIKIKSIHRRILLEILEIGIKGQPVLEKLLEFEIKLSKAIDDDIDRQLKKMPLYSLFPLLFLQLPSLMIIGFMPFIGRLSSSIGGQF